MFSKALITLCAAALVGEVVAASPRHNAHQHVHQKKALVTNVVTVTDWVTVYATDGESATSTSSKVFVADTHKHTHTSAASSSSSSSSSTSSTTSTPATSSTSTPEAAPTTMITQTKPSSSSVDVNINVASSAPALSVVVSVAVPPVVAVPAPSVEKASPTTQAAAQTSAASSGNSGSSGQAGTALRGLAYNHANLLPSFTGSGSKVHWTYNWGQSDDSGIGLEFVPMLWGTTKGFPATWAANAQTAIDAGSKCLVSFNEPDNVGQAAMTPAAAAASHIELMNPFASKARIGTPAITNSNIAGEGIDWLKAFFSACNGKCAADFTPIHIYGVSTSVFLQHLLDVYNEFKLPVWITEFAFSGSDDEINQALSTIINQLETNSTFSFVERYSYFMVAEGSLVSSGTSLTTYGNTFAYGS
ncbi:glycosyl hydrolase catalytic core-domain-containing protein [Diplogelasinospora grovesii]|uniref:Glycosyl hydrolase catalytic core-domain-containing protein n=1 Tax=Diplogelasinospora grovesii TaxID=303347 RepID=A0AAN6NHZ2_9PEZI|nr:glycosyl hydrolase catalytic core-domain-containing protein [Diplogelasinospora grovesii]